MKLVGRRRRKNFSDFCPYPKNLKALYTDYRDGDQRQVGLPGLKLQTRRILHGQKREHVISETMALLKAWRTSPFECEGPTRAGLRSAFCLDGARWNRADAEAESVLAECFRVLGAERPSWDEGQQRYVDHGMYCLGCGGPMPEDLVSDGRNQRFCSPECARGVVVRRDAAEEGKQGAIYSAALRIVQREQMVSKKCLNCKRDFVSLSVRKHSEQKFCSHACADSFGRTNAYEAVCISCGSSFVGKHPHAVYCSAACRSWPAAITHRGKLPSKISARFFDFLFTAPIALARAAHETGRASGFEVIANGVVVASAQYENGRRDKMFLTVALFDGLFKEAA